VWHALIGIHGKHLAARASTRRVAARCGGIKRSRNANLGAGAQCATGAGRTRAAAATRDA
jgi:hypothetical protein